MLCPKGGSQNFWDPILPEAVGEWVWGQSGVGGGSRGVGLIQAEPRDFSTAPVFPIYTLPSLSCAPGQGVTLEGKPQSRRSLWASCSSSGTKAKALSRATGGAPGAMLHTTASQGSAARSLAPPGAGRNRLRPGAPRPALAAVGS